MNEQKRSKKWFYIAGAVILIAIAILLAIFLTRSKKESSVSVTGFKGPLSINTSAELEKENSKTINVSAAGEVMWTRSSDGTLYTLTIPPDAVILPTSVTMTPVKNVPFKNFGKSAYGSGVKLSESFTFIRPVYLTIQPNTAEPTDLDNTGTRVWGRCTVGSRGFDPEVCAAQNKVPFVNGIIPGKVMAYGSTKFDTIRLNPTIPTGDKKSLSGMVWRSGYYMFSKINKAQAKDLTDMMFAGSNDYTNQTETLMHYYALGGDLTPYKSEIARFERQKDDYMREVYKGAILALAIKETKAYEARLASFWERFEKNTGVNIRASFVPPVRYVAVAEQLDVNPVKKASWLNRFIDRAYAGEAQLGNYNGSESSGGDSGQSWWDKWFGGNDDSNGDLPDYDPNNNPPDDNPGDNLPDYNPDSGGDGELPDYPGDNIPGGAGDGDATGGDWGEPEDNSQDAREDARRQADEARKRTIQRLKDIIGSSVYPCSAKREAIEAFLRLVPKPDASDMEAINNVITKCANACKTLEECESWGDTAGRNGNRDGVAAANYRILAFLESEADCTAETKKTLENYGQNFCQNAKFQ